MKGFVNFIREQGVVGLAVGFILGGAVSKVVTAFINDIINPILGLTLGVVGDLKTASVSIAGAKLMYGDFLGVLVDFVVVAFVVYFGIKVIGIENLDKKKS